MSTPPAPARLHVLFARNAPIGVIFRRGPTEYVRLILWHTKADLFEPGQWLKGRIHGDMASLSPNGKLLAYFATDHRPSRQKHGGDNGWIALSRPPYLSALTLWFNSGDPREGHVAFQDDRTLLGPVHDPAPGYALPEWLRVAPSAYRSDPLSVRGWRSFPPSPELNEQRQAFLSRYPDLPAEAAVYFYPSACYKLLADGRTALELHPFSWNWIPRLRDRSSGAERLLDIEQAEVDQHGRLILVRGGKLFAATVGEDLTFTEQELADFNDMTFEPIPPPDWATQWP